MPDSEAAWAWLSSLHPEMRLQMSAPPMLRQQDIAHRPRTTMPACMAGQSSAQPKCDLRSAPTAGLTMSPYRGARSERRQSDRRYKTNAVARLLIYGPPAAGGQRGSLSRHRSEAPARRESACASPAATCSLEICGEVAYRRRACLAWRIDESSCRP